MLTTLLSLYASTALFGFTPANAAVNTWKDSVLLEATAIPHENIRNVAPVIKAKSVLAVDLKNGFPLFEKGIYDRRPIASISKLMTIILILEENKMDDVVTVSKKASQTSGSRIWLAPGEKITVENLLSASMIASANDAAYALAEFNSNSNVKDFVAKMNQKAKSLGLNDTHFTNPVGFDDKENYSSAYDLSVLARYAFGKEFVRKTGVIKELEIKSTDGKLKHKLKTTNDLLSSYLKVLGLKTGTTDLAGQCLIAIIENDKGHDILTVMLDSPSRYQETKVLADWIFRTYKW